MNLTTAIPSAPRHFAREVYSVKGARVVFDDAHGWECTCATFAADHQCEHLVQAQTYRQMRGVKREEDTVELQFTEAELEVLARAEQRALEKPEATAPPAPAILVGATRRNRRRSPWSTLTAAATIAGLSSGITYLATTQAQPDTRVIERVLLQEATPQVAHIEPPVTFINPFDKSEIFQFPSGTTDTEARDAVAAFLIERAREREGGTAEPSLRTGKTAVEETLPQKTLEEPATST